MVSKAKITLFGHDFDSFTIQRLFHYNNKSAAVLVVIQTNTLCLTEKNGSGNFENIEIFDFYLFMERFLIFDFVHQGFSMAVCVIRVHVFNIEAD